MHGASSHRLALYVASGGWEDMATLNFTGQHAQTITYDCAGTGIHDFRTYINSQHADGSYEFHESNHINANCG